VNSVALWSSSRSRPSELSMKTLCGAACGHFCGDILEHGVVEHSFRQQLLEHGALVSSALSRFASGNLQAAVLRSPLQKVALLMPCLRQRRLSMRSPPARAGSR